MDSLFLTQNETFFQQDPLILPKASTLLKQKATSYFMPDALQTLWRHFVLPTKECLVGCKKAV